jgi:hypothetical protein
MAKKTPTFNGVNFAIWMVLIAFICTGLLIFYNKTVFEKFEGETEEETEEKKEPEEKKEKKSVKEEMDGDEKKKPELDPKEQSLFEKIVKNEVSSADLEKLINAGVVTQNMVEKFLSKLDEKQEKEASIEGFSCGGNYAYVPS